MSNRSIAAARALPLLAALLATAPAHAEPALIARATGLQAQPQSDAPTLAALPERARVELLRRSGAWSEVRTAAGQTGWVRMLALQPAGGDGARAAPDPESGNPLGALDKLLTSGRTSSKATVTTGVRGLPKEEVPPAVSADEAAARVFAQGSKLVPVTLDAPPPPAPDADTGRWRDGR